MNILFLKFPLTSVYGGGEFHTITLVDKLTQRGINFYLTSSCKILLDEFKKRNWPTDRVWAGIEPVSKIGVLIFPFLAPFVFIRLAGNILWYKIKKKVNLIFCLSLTEKILLTFWAKLLGLEVIWIEHLLIEKWLTYNPLKFLYVLNSRLTTVVAVSQAVKKGLIKLGVREKNIKVIYNGVDLDKFKPFFKEDDRIIRIGTVCRLSKEKGVEYLILSAKQILNKMPNVEFLIVGTGNEEDKLKELAQKLEIGKKIRFVGFQRDVIKYLSELDIFTLTPIRRESFGIGVAEAMACGIPVVATNIGGLSELVKDGLTGFIVPPKDPKAIANALIKLIKDVKLRKKMGVLARQRVEEKFGIQKMIDEFYNLFLNKK